MSCTLDKQYSYRISACQPSCFDPYPVCNEGYTEGCVCKPGTILSGTECVPRLYCGCTYKGMYLKVNFYDFHLLKTLFYLFISFFLIRSKYLNIFMQITRCYLKGLKDLRCQIAYTKEKRLTENIILYFLLG